MPTRPGRIPSYRLHKPSGQAVVTLSGKDHYLGPHGSEQSRAEYDRLVGQWQANGRLPLGKGGSDLSINELMVAYLSHADGYYVKAGKPTSQVHIIKLAIRPVREMYGDRPVTEFGPLALKAVRNQWIERGVTRRTINGHVDRIRLIFRWGVEEELVPETIYSALKAVRNLAKGRTKAPDREPVGPAPEEAVEAVIPHLRPEVQAMVRLQVLTGMRPGEVSALRACDIDRTGPVWTYQVTEDVNKTEHHERSRTVFFGPKAQAIVSPWIERFPEGYLFRPRGWNPRPGPRKTPRVVADRYEQNSYWQAIRDGCKKAFPHPTLSGKKRPQLTPEEREELKRWNIAHRFNPNRLRHTAATRIRRQFGLDAARTILGHADLKTSEIYAELDLGKACSIMGQIG